MHRRKVASRNHDVPIPRSLGETPGLAEVTMNVTERQHGHQTPNGADFIAAVR